MKAPGVLGALRIGGEGVLQIGETGSVGTAGPAYCLVGTPNKTQYASESCQILRQNVSRLARSPENGNDLKDPEALLESIDIDSIGLIGLAPQLSRFLVLSDEIQKPIWANLRARENGFQIPRT